MMESETAILRQGRTTMDPTLSSAPARPGLRRRANSIQLALLALSNERNQYYRKAHKDLTPFIKLADSAPLFQTSRRRSSSAFIDNQERAPITAPVRPSLLRSATANIAPLDDTPAPEFLPRRRPEIGRNPPSYQSRRSSIASIVTTASSLYGTTALGLTCVMSHPPTYMLEPEPEPSQPQAEFTSVSVTVADVESQDPLRRDRLNELFHSPVVRVALLVWAGVLVLSACVSFIPAVHPYMVVLWMPLVLTVGAAVAVCAERGRRTDLREWRERQRREAEQERIRQRHELPEGYFFSIDETETENGNGNGHTHPVMTLLPPPPKYNDLVESGVEGA